METSRSTLPARKMILRSRRRISQRIKSLSAACRRWIRIPRSSEEDPPSWEVRQHWQRYWLVDPLDGTKEFIKRNGEFTVNIALIENGKPTLGVVYAPVMKVMYSAQNGKAGKKSAAYASRSRSAMPVRRWW